MEATEPKTIEQMAESLLAPEVEETEEVEEVSQDEADENETETDETEEDESEEEVSEADEDPEEGEQDEDDEEEPDAQEALISVKIDGEEKQVTLEELKRGYSGQEFIQKGLQQNAEAKKQVEGVYQALQQEREQLANLTRQIQETGLVQKPTPPSRELLQSDPIGYMEQQAAYQDAVEQYNQQQSQIQEVTTQQSEQMKRAQQAYLAEQAELLKQALPDLADPQKGSELRDGLVRAGTHYGFDPSEVAGIQDHRAVKVLHDAMKWRELQASKAKAEKKAATARPVVRPSAKRSEKQTAAQKRKAKLNQLKRTGDARLAAELLLE